jgi:hypothetical protein
MNRTAIITTKVRPVKKMFVIEHGDIDRITAIIKLRSREIYGLSNLIMENGDELFNANTLQFVNRHDPDARVLAELRSADGGPARGVFVRSQRGRAMGAASGAA